MTPTGSRNMGLDQSKHRIYVAAGTRGRRELDVYCFLPVNVPSPSSPSEILPVIVFPLTVPV
jgi:hypothetical protein